MKTERFTKQIEFILEIDKLKNIFRQSFLLDKNRKENSAEHSWHVALIAIILMEHANSAVDILKVVKMLLIHDIVEIDAGDTYLYDPQGANDKEEREIRAAERIFSLLPEAQGDEFKDIWREFEDGTTPEAVFAKSVDRLMPLLHNYHTQGVSWKEHNVTKKMVVSHIQDDLSNGAEIFWEHASSIINDAVEKGFLKEL